MQLHKITFLQKSRAFLPTAQVLCSLSFTTIFMKSSHIEIFYQNNHSLLALKNLDKKIKGWQEFMSPLDNKLYLSMDGINSSHPMT